MTFEEKIIHHLKLNEKELVEIHQAPSFSKLPDISSNKEVIKAITRLKKAKANNERVLVYGDYDCDGITATTIIYDTLIDLGITAGYYIPSRFIDGYGLNLNNTKSIKEAGWDIIFTVDNGVRADEALEFASNNNIDVILLDHHEYENVNYPYVSLMHPKTLDLTSPSVSAGFLSYLFRRSILNKDDDYHFILGSTSLLSDCMPLKSYNHMAIKLLLELLNKNPIVEYKMLLKKEPIQYTEEELNYYVIPAINSIGRVVDSKSINYIIQYLSSYTRIERKYYLLNFVKGSNDNRKTLTNDYTSCITSEGLIDENNNYILLNLDDVEGVHSNLNPLGINGLVATRLLSTYNKPSCVICSDIANKNAYVGSLRSKNGFNIQELFEFLDIPTLGGGGHAYAGGIHFDKEYLNMFNDQFSQFASKHNLIEEQLDSILLNEEDLTFNNYQILRSYGPFGQDYKEPLFSIELPINRLSFTSNGQFLSTKINESRLFSFKYTFDCFKDKNSRDIIKIFFTMSKNEFNGHIYSQCLVKKIKF